MLAGNMTFLTFCFGFSLSMAGRSFLDQTESSIKSLVKRKQFRGAKSNEGRANCGYSTDCPQSYTILSIEDMARDQIEQRFHDSMADVRDTRRVQCENLLAKNLSNIVLPDGGWCYDKAKSTAIQVSAHSDRNYLLPANHVVADTGFAAVVADMMRKPNAPNEFYSISDLGAGVGQFGHFLKAHIPQLEYHGYDGAGNVEDFTENYVRFADLSKPMHGARTDYVLSSEVGEHIPHEFEAQFIANIHAHNCKGVILTWAVLDQGGFAHVNCHSNEYIRGIFTQLGYTFNDEMTQKLRQSAKSSPWLTNSTQVFERATRPMGCP